MSGATLSGASLSGAKFVWKKKWSKNIHFPILVNLVSNMLATFSDFPHCKPTQKSILLVKLAIREYIWYYNANAIFTEGQAARAFLNFSYILNQWRIEFSYLGSRPLCKGKYLWGSEQKSVCLMFPIRPYCRDHWWPPWLILAALSSVPTPFHITLVISRCELYIIT